jgi:hypothetical protein
MASGKEQTIEELANAIDLPKFTTKRIVEYLKHDILLALYRKNPEEPKYMEDFNIEMNRKVAEVYQEWYGKKFDPKVQSKSKTKPMFLMGPPGQGKTASYIAAAKEVCAAMDLNFIEHVTDDYMPEKRDFLMVVQECAGANSDVTFGGLPKAEEMTLGDGTKRTVLKSAINYRFSLFDQCAGGVFLLDDAANAPGVIQNILLPVAQFGTFRGLKIKNACVGFTGNLGALDGTHTSEQSSALITRVYPVFTTDTLKDFVSRSTDEFNDDLASVGYLAYLQMRGDRKFASLPVTGSKSGFKCSRTHQDFIRQIRSFLERAGGLGNEDKILADIHGAATGAFGLAEGSEVFSYFDSYTRGAAPLARKYIMEKKSGDKKEFDEKYKGGSGPEDMSFAYQFASACGDYAVAQIAGANDPEKQLKETMKHYGQSILRLNESEFSFALDYFKNALTAAVPKFAYATKEGRELNNDIRENIAHLINDLEDCGGSRRDILIKVITDFDKVEGANIWANKKGGRKAVA